MQVLAAVSPPADVNAPDMVDRTHCPLDAREEEAQLGCEVVRQVAGFCVMGAWLEEHHHRQAGGAHGRA
ncbi:MAG: hypothetical protein PVS2B1_16160 [Candidatus Dormibacteraceae bacterium]